MNGTCSVRQSTHSSWNTSFELLDQKAVLICFFFCPSLLPHSNQSPFCLCVSTTTMAKSYFEFALTTKCHSDQCTCFFAFPITQWYHTLHNFLSNNWLRLKVHPILGVLIGQLWQLRGAYHAAVGIPEHNSHVQTKQSNQLIRAKFPKLMQKMALIMRISQTI